MIYDGPKQIVYDKRQYDVALANFEVRIRNIIDQAVNRVRAAHKL
jgi:hypothetical protein